MDVVFKARVAFAAMDTYITRSHVATKEKLSATKHGTLFCMSGVSHESSSIDLGRARELTQMSAEQPLAWGVPTGCGAKAIGVMALLRLQGESDVGVEMSYVPDLSAEGIRRAESSQEAMRFSQSSYSFTKRLQTGLGDVDMDAKAVEWGDTRLSEIEIDGSSYVLAERLAPVSTRGRQGPLADLLNNNRWHISSPGQDVYMCNHTAARLGNMIIDPGYEKDRPLSPQEWRECQGFADAVILSDGTQGDVVPFRAHADLMPSEQRRRYDDLLKENGVTHELLSNNPVAYRAVMSHFFNLGGATLGEDDLTATPTNRVSLLLARTILEGNDNYDLPQDDAGCEEELKYRTDRLSLAMTYQRWLEETDAVLAA